MANGSKLDLPKAAMIRELNAAGASTRALAHAFLCSQTLVRMVLRGEIWMHRPCDGCRTPISGQNTSGLCQRCKAQFCCRCGAAKFPTRQSPQCVTCDRQKWRTHVATREHVCRQCGEGLPETRRDVLCTECRGDEQAHYLVFRQKRAKEQGIICKNDDCENLVPTCKSWTRATCRDCAKEHDRRRRSLSRRQCAVCGRVLDDRERGVCRQHRAEMQRRQRAAAKAARQATEWAQSAAGQAARRLADQFLEPERLPARGGPLG